VEGARVRRWRGCAAAFRAHTRPTRIGATQPHKTQQTQVDWATRADFKFFDYKWFEGRSPSRSRSRTRSPKPKTPAAQGANARGRSDSRSPSPRSERW